MFYNNYSEIDYGRFELISENINKGGIIPLSEFKQRRNISSSDTEFDTEYQSYINIAVRLIEAYLGYNLLNTQYYYYLNSFADSSAYNNINDKITLIYNKGNINAILNFSYLKDTTWTVIDSARYQIAKTSICDSYITAVQLISGSFPTDITKTINSIPQECVRLTIVSGFGDAVNTIPQEIIYAIYQMAFKLLDSKGQAQYSCDECNSVFSTIPRQYVAKKSFV